MKFKLFDKLASLEGKELVLFIAALVVTAGLAALIIYAHGKKRTGKTAPASRSTTRALVMGALCLSLSFVLSYLKLFSMPFGGSVTLCSMLPLVMYAAAFGPRHGFPAAFAYALLQIIQGAWIVHWAQFLLDYFIAFTLLGLASFFPKKLPLGMAVAGFARMCASVVSGVIFFADGGLDYGIADPWLYSLLYSGTTIGIDTVLCVAVSFLPPIRRLYVSMKKTN